MHVNSVLLSPREHKAQALSRWELIESFFFGQAPTLFQAHGCGIQVDMNLSVDCTVLFLLNFFETETENDLQAPEKNTMTLLIAICVEFCPSQKIFH